MPVRLRSIDIKNFRGIESLHLDFPEHETPEREGGPAPVMLLSGENGVGKTAVLEAICAAPWCASGATTSRSRPCSTRRPSPPSLRRASGSGRPP